MLSETVRYPSLLHEIRFEAVTRRDLPLFRRWMNGAHWREWWGDPESELAQIEGMLDGRDSTRPYLFHINGEPTGYIQVWFVADNLFEPWISEAPWLLALPDEAVGVDLSIGPEHALSKGLGSQVLQRFAEQLWDDGYRFIVIDPDPNNGRAVRAYEKAGFEVMPAFVGKTKDCLLMRYQPKQKETIQ